MGDAVRQMVDRRSRRVLVPHSMNVPVDTEQQVRSHVAVQEQQRMGGISRIADPGTNSLFVYYLLSS